MNKKEFVTQIPEPTITRLLFADTRLAWVWVIIRLYVGWFWVDVGWKKVHNSMWVGDKAGLILRGFINSALNKTGGTYPDVAGWYAAILQDIVLPHTAFFAPIVAFGELLVGVGLILGAFTGLAAFFGSVMNMSYLFAGTVSVNPIMALLQLFIILAWRVAGWFGVDRYLLPLLGTPWYPGKLFKRTPSTDDKD